MAVRIATLFPTQPSLRAGRARDLWWVLALATMFLGVGGQAWGQDVARGAQLFRVCASCHGEAGQGQRAVGAPVLAGLPGWYVEAQLQKFRQGVRGAHPEDFRGLQMRPMARSLYSDEDVRSVAAYVTTLRVQPAKAASQGDPVKGKTMYTACAACHGAQARGNEAVKAPALAFQDDWYIVAQLTKFKQGLRGAHKDDTTGAQMRAMSLTVPTEQAMHDLAAYISFLGQEIGWRAR